MIDRPQDEKRPLWAVGTESRDGEEAIDPAEEEMLASADPAQRRSERRARIRQRGIYLLPNLITTGALFAGFMP